MTQKLASALRQVASDLDEIEAEWALVGGLAVSARAEPRTTRDIDIAVVVADDAAAERLTFALVQRGYVVLATVEQKRLSRLATVRLRAPTAQAQGPIVDLLFCSSSIEPETVRHAERIEAFPSLRVPVATIPHLIAMKVLARDDRRRPQDWDDLRALLTEATSEEVELARELLAMIERRGASRGRDLLPSFESLLAEHGSKQS